VTGLRIASWSLRVLALAIVAFAGWALWVWEREPVRLTFVYSTDAAPLVNGRDSLVAQFNARDPRDRAVGFPHRRIVVRPIAAASGAAASRIAARTLPADVWLPALTYWVETLPNGWASAGQLAAEPLVISPLVFVAPPPGRPPPATWQAVLDQASAGALRFAHTNPETSTSGLIVVSTAMDWAHGDPKQVAHLEGSVTHYADTGNDILAQLGRYGAGYADGVIVQENSLARYNEGVAPSLRLVGTLPADRRTYVASYPLVALSAPWSNDDRREASTVFTNWLRAQVDDVSAAAAGFRRQHDPPTAPPYPLDLSHGIDPAPFTALAAPSPEDLMHSRGDWPRLRKPASVGIAVDPACARDPGFDAFAHSLVAEAADHDHVGLWIAGRDQPVVSAANPVSVSRAWLEQALDGVEPAKGASYPWRDVVRDAVDAVPPSSAAHAVATGVIVLTPAAEAGNTMAHHELLRHIEQRSGTSGSVRIVAVSCAGATPEGRQGLGDLVTAQPAAKGGVFDLASDDAGSVYRSLWLYE
jgi:hypothetical protein